MSGYSIYCGNCHEELFDESEIKERLHEKCRPNPDELVKLMKFANDIKPLLQFKPFEEIGISNLRNWETGADFKSENGIVTFFSFRNNESGKIPMSFYQFTNLKKLILQKCLLPVDQLESLSKMTELEDIWFSEISFKETPNSLTQLKKLKKLVMDYGEFIKIGDAIGQLPQLEHLELDNNVLEVKTLPDSIGQLKNLKYLDLSGNCLTAIPESIGRLKNLKELEIRRNELTTLPDSIKQLKKRNTVIGSDI